MKLHWKDIQREIAQDIGKEFRRAFSEILNRHGPGATIVEMSMLLFRSVPSRENFNSPEFTAVRSEAFFKTMEIAGGPDVFVIARDFSEALREVAPNIPVRHLPVDGKFRCIELPRSIRIGGSGSSTRTVYVFGEPSRNGRPSFIHFVFVGDDGAYYSHEFFIENNDLNISQTLVEQYKLVPVEVLETMTYVVNCLIYIDSGDPDLRFMAKHTDLRASTSGGDPGDVIEYKQPFPVTLVGFNHKKPPIYYVGEAYVRTHPRWQPCGPGREQVKLVWVKAHMRHFKNVVETPEQEQPQA